MVPMVEVMGEIVAIPETVSLHHSLPPLVLSSVST